MTAKSSQTDKAAPPAPNGDVWDKKNISQKEPAVNQDYSVAFEEEDYACLCLHYQIMIMFFRDYIFPCNTYKANSGCCPKPSSGYVI